MTATRRSADDESRATTGGASGSESGGSLLQTDVAGIECDSCGTPMAPDQRYCVECGTRRGKPRFALAPAGGGAQPVERPAAASTGRPSTMILIAGIVTVLLALGVGFLIGKSASKASSVHVTLTTNGAASGASSSSGSGGSSTTSGSHTNSNGSGSGSSTGTGTTPSNGNFFGGGGG
jgi:hypothetical protein